MHKSILSVTGIIILGAILLLLNTVSQALFRSWYVDLTGEKLYTLTQGTKNIIDTVEQPVTLKFYFSKTDAAKYPGIKLYGARIIDFLKEYERIGHGNIIVEYYDPRPDSEDEEWAQKYGLTPLQLPTGERLFFGLAGVNSAGNEAAIPVFNLGRQEFLEYDVTKLVYTLLNTKKPVVGILSSINVKGGEVNPMARLQGQMPDQGPWFFVSQLNELAQVKYLEPTLTKIDDEIDTLLVIHPKNFPDQVMYAIDQFALRGGNLFVFVDPYCQADQPPQDPSNPMMAMAADRSSNLNRLLSSWGVEQLDKKAVADTKLATKVNTGRGGTVTEFALWLNLRSENTNRENVATSAIDNLLLPWAGAFKLKTVDGISHEQLFTSSADAMLVSDEEFRFGGGDPEQLRKKYLPGHEKQVLGVRIFGKLKTNFPDGPVNKEQSSQSTNESSVTQPAPLKESSGTSNVVVMGDVDFLADQFSISQQNIFGRRIVTPLNDNIVLLLNMVENLAGSSDLISIRSRGRFSRPFTKVEEIEARAQLRWQQEETVFEAKLNAANQRLNQLQASDQNKDEQMFSSAVLGEIKKLREERKEAQDRLRDVRRKLREDKERLGVVLFILNTFVVPVLLIIVTLTMVMIRKRKAHNTLKNKDVS